MALRAIHLMGGKAEWAQAMALAARCVLVGLAYVVTQVLVGAAVGMGRGGSPTDSSAFGLARLFVAGLAIGLCIGPVAAGVHAARARHVLVWGTLIFLNLVSVFVEGSVFAPGLLPQPGALLFQQFAAATLTALAIAFLLGGSSPRQLEKLRARPLYAWIWRFALSSFSYVVFYFIFGALNYALVTRPYYEASANGLAVPPLSVILTAEALRAPLMVLSLLPFLLTVGTKRARVVLLCGYLLFGVGGVVPLLNQVGTLPGFLLIASAWEILLQNFATGAVAALLLRPASLRSTTDPPSVYSADVSGGTTTTLTEMSTRHSV